MLRLFQRLDIVIYAVDAGLRSVFRRTALLAARMIANWETALLLPFRIGPGRPSLAGLGLEYELFQFCLV